MNNEIEEMAKAILDRLKKRKNGARNIPNK